MIPIIRTYPLRSWHLAIFLFFSLTVRPAVANDALEYEGLIEPNEVINVGSPVEGVVQKVNVQKSSTVKEGEMLVTLESSVEAAIVNRAKMLVASEAELKLQLERLAYAKRVRGRVEELFASEAIAEEKRDEAATEVTMAQARLQKAKENRMVAELDLQQAEAMLNRRTIKSPINGVVVERYVSTGEFVDNQPLLKIAQMDPLRIEVILPVDMFNKIKPGMTASVTPETRLDQSYQATVSIVDRVMDPASGTFGVRLELPNPDYRLPGGLKCTVRFQDNSELKLSVKPENDKNGTDHAQDKRVCKLPPSEQE